MSEHAADEFTCPLCGADLRGEAIPQEYIDKGYYGSGATHYSRKIGHEVRGVYDGTLFWSCPDCVRAWPRFDWPVARAHVAAFNGELA